LAHIYVATKERPELQYDRGDSRLLRDANNEEAKYNQYKDAWLYHGLLYSIYHEMKNVREAKKEYDKTAASKATPLSQMNDQLQKVITMASNAGFATSKHHRGVVSTDNDEEEEEEDEPLCE
jgi:hypothetical protein